MPGPPPKDPLLRQRRNRSVSADVLTDDRSRARVPALPRRLPKKDGGKVVTPAVPWHPLTLAWWRELWRSPIACRFLRLEAQELLVIAQLRDDFHYATTPRDRQALAGELRLQAARFGLDQLSRWRLQWEVPSDLSPVARPVPTPPAAGPEPSAADRRKVLSILQPKRTA